VSAAISIPQQADWPLYWFAKLEQAIEEGDHQTAATAQRELARLGVRVAYGRPTSDAYGTDAERQGAN